MGFKTRNLLCLLLVLFLSACSHTPRYSSSGTVQSEYGVSEFVLSNGLKLLVKEDHRSPVVVSQIWYRVGSADEYAGITGISHALEHMMFKGTDKYPRQAFTEIIKKNGGRDNAFTGRDYTAYYQLFEKSHLEISFDLESDRMVNLKLDPKDFEKEREVVREERRLRVDDNPNSRIWEQLYISAFNYGPYRQPVIGWDDDLVGLELEDLSNWYRLWYAPNNATLVVVGDVVADEVHTLARLYFGHLKPIDLPQRKARTEKPQHGERRVTMAITAVQPTIAMGYRTARHDSARPAWHPYALSVLARVLSGTGSARFSKNLIRGSAIAQSAYSGYSTYSRYEDLFVIGVTPNSGVDINQIEQAIEKELEQLKQTPVRSEELSTIKAQLIASEVYQQDSIQHQAYLLGQLETIGVGWREQFHFRERIAAVTAEQVMQVADEYLNKKNRTVVILKPQSKEQ